VKALLKKPGRNEVVVWQDGTREFMQLMDLKPMDQYYEWVTRRSE